jgi:hypothetical protein
MSLAVFSIWSVLYVSVDLIGRMCMPARRPVSMRAR